MESIDMKRKWIGIIAGLIIMVFGALALDAGFVVEAAAIAETRSVGGTIRTGWIRDGGDWYYYSEDGVKQTGWVQVGNDWYFMDFRGVMQTGWQKLGGRWFYFRKNGTMLTGWKQEKGYWFFLKASGAVTIGWQQIGGRWYFVGQTGRMLTGWRCIGGKWYFFEETGCMAADVWLGDYYLDENGVWDPEAGKKPRGSAKLDMACILQNPELPNGCEVTSLAIVLNHLGFSISKGALADGFLPQGRIGSTSPYDAYIGNPRNKDASWYCYSPVIVKCANGYLATQGTDRRAEDLTGSDFDQLLIELDRGNPVIFWATTYMNSPSYGSDWVINGRHYVRHWNLHCMVLTGYDTEQDLGYVADPLRGNVTYSLSRAKLRYEQIYSQAVVIR